MYYIFHDYLRQSLNEKCTYISQNLEMLHMAVVIIKMQEIHIPLRKSNNTII